MKNNQTSMTQQQPFYSIKKLIQALKDECEKKNPSYSDCTRLMKNLGILISATDDIDIGDAEYQSLWKIASATFSREKNVPLGLRIITVHVYANITIKSARSHKTYSDVAFTLLINELKNEAGKLLNKEKSENPSTAFLIAIFDSIYLCANEKTLTNDKDTLEALLSLQSVMGKLTKCTKDSIAVALDIDLVPFVKNYN